MKTQFPNAYTKSNTTYIYYSDSGEQIKLVAGEAGVTTEIIAALKLEHQKEIRSDHKRLHYIRSQEGWIQATVSYDALTDKSDDYEDDNEQNDNIFANSDEDPARVLDQMIADIEFREKFHRFWDSLSELQRQTIIELRIKHVSECELAAATGVSQSAIAHRFEGIEKKFLRFFAGTTHNRGSL